MGKLTRPNNFMLDGQFGVNVKDFGPAGMVGNGDPVYDGPAFQKAQAYLNTASEQRGGTLLIPRGVYRPTQTFSVTDYNLVQSVYVKGEGPINTQIYGDALPNFSDAFFFDKGVHFGIEGLMIAGSKRSGVRIKGGDYNAGSSGFVSQGYVKNLRVQQSVESGIHSENTYLCTFDDIWSVNNGLVGFEFRGFHTSIKMGRCYAAGHLNGPGFEMNSMIYSSMTTCASDDNKWAYSFTNISGFQMMGCGAEANHNATILLRASDALAAGALQECADINSLVISGGYFMTGNSKGGDGAAPSFIDANAINSRQIRLIVDGCTSLKNPAHPNDPTITAAAAAGSTISITGRMNKFNAPNVTGGAGTVNLSFT